jgi:lysophospholipase L1-like esterase
VIGDSMVKNIGASKIGRAARSKAISHSYSGATVNQLTKKFENHQSEQEFSTVIIHIGTNDLVHDEPKKVAANLGNLINKVKVHTEKISVSGTIKRYDCKLNNKKLSNITI